MRRTVIALTLIGSLVSQPSLFDPIWSVLSSIWSESNPGMGNGDPIPASPPEIDEGCGGDPNGCPKGS